jgi:hypothetical protein
MLFGDARRVRMALGDAIQIREGTKQVVCGYIRLGFPGGGVECARGSSLGYLELPSDESRAFIDRRARAMMRATAIGRGEGDAMHLQVFVRLCS